MAFAETANLAVKLTLGGNFLSQMGKVNSSLGKLEKGSGRAYKAGAQIGTGIKNATKIAAVGVGFLVTQVGFGLDSLIQLENATTQTNAVIKSTKGVAHESAQAIRDLAEHYESLNATIDDKVIQSGENVLLTFTNIRKKAFEPALLASLNLSTAMHKDLQSSIVLVGKALNNPTKGLTALTRVGVKFTDGQIKRIKALEKEGKLYEAQKIILGELNTEFGGSFLAGGQTTAGKVAKFGDAIEDLQQALASALLPAVSAVADGLTNFLADPTTIAGVRDLSKEIAKLFSPANIKTGIGLIKDGFGAIKAIAGPIADVIGTAVKAFTSLPPDIQKLLVGGFVANKLTGGLVTNVAGGLISAVLSQFKGALNVNAAVVNVNGGVPGVGGVPGGGGGGILGAAKSLIIPVAIAGVTVAAAKVLTDAIDPSLQGAIDDPTGAHGTPLAQRDPRRFANNGSFAQNVLPPGTPAGSRGDIDHFTGPITKATAAAAREAKVATELAAIGTAAVIGATGGATVVATQFAGQTAANAALIGSANIVSAIYASRPIVNVSVSPTTINKVTTVNNRYGPSSGSRDQDGRYHAGNGGA